MCKVNTTHITGLTELSKAIEAHKKVEEDLFNVLSNDATLEKKRNKARKKLESKVELILSSIKAVSDTRSLDESTLKDYCRNLAAYVLTFKNNGNLFYKAFLALEGLLETLAPSYKPAMREIKKQYKQDMAYVEHIGFAWDDLKIPFDADTFAAAYCESVISIKEKTEVKIVEKEILVETVVERETCVIREVTKEENKNCFGKEDQHTEFKASYIESYNKKRQLINICKAICAFLNADGGILYIGVNDSGVAIPTELNGVPYGLAKELEYMYRAHRLPNMKKDMDAFARAIYHEVLETFKRFGNEVEGFKNNIIVTECPRNEAVIQIEVRPAKYNVVSIDGVYYQRCGAASVEMDEIQIQQRFQNLMHISKSALFRQKIQKAIQDKKQVRFYGYTSVNSATRTNRFVEPIHFVCNGDAVICFDIDKRAIRQFKLSRIGDIKEGNNWEYEEFHKTIKTDAFGWSEGETSFEICMALGIQAATRMQEQYSSSLKEGELTLNAGSNNYVFYGVVYNLAPVRHFYLSNADDITIMESKDSDTLKNNIQNFITENILKPLQCNAH